MKITDYPTAFLQCRVDRHAWEQYTDKDFHTVAGELAQITRVLECDRCRSQREEELRIPEFTRFPGIKPRYYLADGYEIKGGGPERGEALAELYRRTGGPKQRVKVER